MIMNLLNTIRYIGVKFDYVKASMIVGVREWTIKQYIVSLHVSSYYDRLHISRTAPYFIIHSTPR